MNVLDLFSGIGGFSLGLERAGMRTVALCEIDPFCRAVLKKHWPGVPCYEDVRSFGAERLRADGFTWSNWPDLICGGFPCQDISVAGKGAGIEGERSGLWKEYARIIGEVRPRYVIVENVAALLGRGLDRVLGDLAALGFDAEWHCIPASAVGAPHRRDRLWIVANADCSGQRERWRAESVQQEVSGAEYDSQDVADAAWNVRSQQAQGGAKRERIRQGCEPVDVADSNGSRLGKQWRQIPIREKFASAECGGWWFAEPNVGFGPDGLSAGLDGDRINADAEERRPNEAMCSLRQTDVTQAFQRQTRGPQCIFGPPVLQQIMHGSGLCQRHAIEIGLVQTSNAIPWEMLRIMWGYDEHSRPSHRRKQTERLAIEYPDLMRQLSCFAPPPCASCWEDGSWENGLSRVAKGVAKRVDRLRSLGNAVVPQIPEIIGRAILESKGQASA